MSKHTPGPWTVFQKFNVRIKDGASIALCASDQRLPNEECEANAHLIAAAPDLLEACEEVMDGHVFGTWDLDDYRANMLKAAIAKARGE